MNFLNLKNLNKTNVRLKTRCKTQKCGLQWDERENCPSGKALHGVGVGAVDPRGQAHSPGIVKGGDLDSGPALLPMSHESHRILEHQDKRGTQSQSRDGRGRGIMLWLPPAPPRAHLVTWSCILSCRPHMGAQNPQHRALGSHRPGELAFRMKPASPPSQSNSAPHVTDEDLFPRSNRMWLEWGFP